MFDEYIFWLLVGGTYIYMTFISRTMKKGRYKYRLISASILLILGLFIDITGVSDVPSGYITVITSAPYIYLIYYELFRRLLSRWIGKYPYTPYANNVGDSVDGLGYPKDRKVKGVDYVFGSLMLVVPMITILIILNKVDKILGY